MPDPDMQQPGWFHPNEDGMWRTPKGSVVDPTNLSAATFEVDQGDPEGAVTSWKLRFWNFFYRKRLTRANQRMGFEISLQVMRRWGAIAATRAVQQWRTGATMSADLDAELTNSKAKDEKQKQAGIRKMRRIMMDWTQNEVGSALHSWRCNTDAHLTSLLEADSQQWRIRWEQNQQQVHQLEREVWEAGNLQKQYASSLAVATHLLRCYAMSVETLSYGAVTMSLADDSNKNTMKMTSLSSIKHVMKRWENASITNVLLGWKAKVAMAAAVAGVEASHNNAMMGALGEAGKRGAIGVMEFILKKMKTRALVAGLMAWKMNMAASGAEESIEAAEAQKAQMMLAAAARQREKSLLMMKRIVARWQGDMLRLLVLDWRAAQVAAMIAAKE